MSYKITVHVHQPTSGSFDIVDKAVWGNPNQVIWTEQSGGLVLTMDSSGACGTLCFQSKSDPNETFAVALGVHNHFKWCDIIPDLKNDQTASTLQAEYYNGSRASRRETHLQTYSLTSAAGRPVKITYTGQNNHNLKASIIIKGRTNLKLASLVWIFLWNMGGTHTFLDAGGVRSLSQLVILGHIMYQMDRENVVLPCEHFDMIGGSDTGGLIAIMFAKLRMSVEEVTNEFEIIVEKAYAKGLEPAERARRLKDCMEDLLRRRNQPLDLKLEDKEPSNGCVGTGIQVYLRTYRGTNEPPTGVTVVEAVLATCASQPDFLPASFGEKHRRLAYVGAGIAASNPVSHVMYEAKSYFGEGSNFSSLLSLGSGHPGIIAYPPGGGKDALRQVSLEMMKSSELKAQETERQIGPSGFYFRFSVEHGMQEHQAIQGPEPNWIYSQTPGYMRTHDEGVKKYLRKIAEGPRGIASNQASTSSVRGATDSLSTPLAKRIGG